MGHHLSNFLPDPSNPLFAFEMNSSSSSSPRLIVSLQLSLGDKSFSVRALVDSGASENFMNQGYASRHLIQLHKQKACPLYLADGSPLVVDQKTPFFKASVKDTNHQELIQFQVLNLHGVDLILGKPWLDHHNPHIDWPTNKISFVSDTCKHRCLGKFPERRKEPLISIVSAQKFISLLTSRQQPVLLGSATQNELSEGANHLGAVSSEPPDSPEPELPAEYKDFSELFSKKAADKIPDHKPWDHHIPLEPGTSPPFGPIYGLSESELKVLREYIDENLERGIIRPSTSPAGAPILFAKKKDGGLRLCVDYRGLNRVTIKNRYALPLISELFDRLRNAKVFSKIDLRGAYNLVRIPEGEEWKTAFRCRYGHFEYLVMPFGLCNAPGTFQGLINDTLREYLDIFCIVYLDDILVFSDTLEEHIDHVRKVLRKLRERDLFCKLSKCQFHVTETDFLGFIVSSEGISMDPRKVTSILNWPEPRSIKQLQSFLGLANFYRRFILNYSKIATPLTSLNRKGSHFKWTEKAQEAFDSLKKSFTEAPVLMHFDPQLPSTLEVDASDFAIGAVLSQTDSTGQTHPIAFYSRKMSPAETNYEIHDKEMLAVVEAMREWRIYLEGASHQITIYTDHRNLEHFVTTKTLNRRQARWSLDLASYDFVIIYRPGSKNTKADALSRRPDYIPQGCEDTSAQSWPLLSQNQFIKLHSIGTATETITELELEIRDACLKEHTTSGIIKALVSESKDAHLTNYSLSSQGLLLFQGLIVIPSTANSLKLKVLRDCHDSASAGHLGIAKTLELVSRSYHWPKMRQFVEDYVSSCIQCNLNKPSRQKPLGNLQQLPIPSRPWESISMDFIVKLPVSEEPVTSVKYDSIWVVVDRLTKMSHFVPCNETISASDLAHLFMSKIFSAHGLPENIVSDRGSLFVSKFISSLCLMADVKQKISTAYHPQTDGQTERVNQVLETYLRTYCNYQQDDWVSYLPLSQFVYNNSEHASTKTSPFYANYGYHPVCKATVSVNSRSPAASERIEFLKSLHKVLKTEISRSLTYQEKYANLKRGGDANFKVGQKVYLMRKHISTSRPSDKLDSKKLGPFKISEIISPTVCKLDLPPSMRIHPIFHVSLLIPHHSSIISSRPEIVPPPPEIIEGQEEYEVEQILDSRMHRRRLEYLIHWKGYGPEDRTWEPVSNLGNSKDLISEFEAKKASRRASR